MSSFANLKRQSGNFDALAKAITSLQNTEASDSKDNFWKPEVDKAGNGMATIRFLPAPGIDGDDSLPWIKTFKHGFKGPGGWLIDNCLTTRNQQCPVCEHNNKLWNSGIEANKAIVREQKRKLNYIANVYIVSDPKHPENEGQVKLFRFGAKIFDKITEAMNPQFDDEKPINPFDLWNGANFKIKIRKVEGYQNYDRSEFEDPAPLFNDDAKMEKVFNAEFSLKELISDKEFKTYDELKGRLEKALGLNGETPAPKTTVETIRETAREEARKPKAEVSIASSEDEDDLSYFSKLAEAD